MTDSEYIKAYATGMFILTFLDEWSKLERIGVVAKIFNTITKKHNVFHKQILEFSQEKRQKLSRKAILYVIAEEIAVQSYNYALKNVKSKRTVVSNTVVHNLYNLNKELLERIYGLCEDDIKKLDNKKHNHVLQSCGIATILIRELDYTIEKQFKGENIANK